MTIALGILASDGVVIAADSQETAQGYWKHNQGKVWFSGYYGQSVKPGMRTAGMYAVAGSGNRADYVDALTQQILDAFKRKSDKSAPEDVKALLSAEAGRFHKDHVAPYAMGENPGDVSLVVGYFRDNKLGLFTTDRGTAIRQNSHGAVGIGAATVKPILSQVWRVAPDVKTAITLAVYCVWLAKERVDGCGNFTDVVYLKGHQGWFIPRDRTRALEDVFARHQRFIETPTLYRSLGANVPAFDASERIEVLRRDVLGVDVSVLEGFPTFDQVDRSDRPASKRGRKGRPPSLG